MNHFLNSAKTLINLHGEDCIYSKVTSGEYDVSIGSVVNSETKFNVKVYRKDLKATQYNYPNLIGKNNVLLYLSADSIVGVPTVNDKFTFGSDSYTVDSVQEHRAFNEVVLYRIVCYRG